jgi:hypothetical protein
MGKWRTLADTLGHGEDAGDNRDNRDNNPKIRPNGPNVPIVPANPDRVLREWKAAFGQLDPCQPPEGWDMRRWQQLYDDAEWLLDKFGDQAARDGWGTGDLWGLWPDKPGWGGIADRLRGSRSLVLTADRAHWRSWGEVERFNKGAYPDLRPFWETAHG